MIGSKKIKRFFISIALLILAAALLLGGIYLARGYDAYRDALEAEPLAKKLEDLREESSFTPLEELPPLYREAVIAAEDHRFEYHNGIDPIALMRALWINLRSGSLKEGGSTITQQLAKNVYFTQEKTLVRKIAECFMARKLEKNLTKDEILELYINHIYYGNGYYCIGDAARGYLGKEPAEMNDYECLLLAGLPNAPSVYNPLRNPDLAEQRRQQVAEKMVRNGALSRQDAEAMKHETIF